MESTKRKELLSRVFTPSSPIKHREFFQGRINQLEKICDSINESGQHAILYGERGVGKTSLANIMKGIFTDLFPVLITCNRSDSFKTLWKRAFSEVKYSITTKGIGFKPEIIGQTVNLFDNIDLNSETFSSDIENVIKRYDGNAYFLFIFDEFDNILDKDVRKSFADLIKSFSDNVNNCSIVLVGIAHNVESLIGSHQSLERCLIQVQMPRMSDEESFDIIEKGLSKLELTIDDEVKSKIVEFSSGFPHYVHLLCKYCVLHVIDQNKEHIDNNDLNAAILKGIENTNGQLQTSYRNAIIGLSTTDKWKNVLFACAQVELDEFNCFNITDVANQYRKITGEEIQKNSIVYNLNQLADKTRGNILEKLDTGLNTRYRFVNPMILAFIKLKINSELIEKRV